MQLYSFDYELFVFGEKEKTSGPSSGEVFFSSVCLKYLMHVIDWQ
jgi:hypothetical protein